MKSRKHSTMVVRTPTGTKGHQGSSSELAPKCGVRVFQTLVCSTLEALGAGGGTKTKTKMWMRSELWYPGIHQHPLTSVTLTIMNADFADDSSVWKTLPGRVRGAAIQ